MSPIIPGIVASGFRLTGGGGDPGGGDLPGSPRFLFYSELGVTENTPGRVAAWADQSGNGLHLAPAGLALEPHIVDDNLDQHRALNGHPCIHAARGAGTNPSQALHFDAATGTVKTLVFVVSQHEPSAFASLGYLLGNHLPQLKPGGVAQFSLAQGFATDVYRVNGVPDDDDGVYEFPVTGGAVIALARATGWDMSSAPLLTNVALQEFRASYHGVHAIVGYTDVLGTSDIEAIESAWATKYGL